MLSRSAHRMLTSDGVSMQQPCHPYFLDLFTVLMGCGAGLLSHTEQSESSQALVLGVIVSVCSALISAPLPSVPGRHSHMDCGEGHRKQAAGN